MAKTVDELATEFMMLSAQGYGEAIVHVDTDSTMGMAAITEVHVEASDKVTLR